MRALRARTLAWIGVGLGLAALLGVVVLPWLGVGRAPRASPSTADVGAHDSRLDPTAAQATSPLLAGKAASGGQAGVSGAAESAGGAVSTPLALPKIVAPLAGRVLDAEGRGVPHARVEAHACEAQEGGLLDMLLGHPEAPPPLARAECADDGSFQFGALPQGTLSLVAMGPERSGSQTFTAVELRVPHARAHPVQHVLLHLAPGRTVRGRVLDLVGRPQAGATLRLLDEDFAGAGRSLPVARRQALKTDDLGRFLLEHVPASAEVDFVVHSAGCAPGRLHVGEDETEVEVRLEPCVEVVVEVRAALDERPVADAEVCLLWLLEGPAYGRGMPGAARGRTGADGRATLCVGATKLRGASVDVAGHPVAFWDAGDPDSEDPAHLEGLAGPAAADVPAPGQVFVLRLSTPRVGQVHVVDASGRGIEGAEVRTLGWLTGRGYATHTDAAGRASLRLHDASSFGDRNVFVRCDGWTPALSEWTSEEAEGPSVRFVLERVATVRGRVLAPDGRPLEGARLGWLSVLSNGTMIPRHLEHDELTQREPVFSSSDGTFLIEGLRPESLVLVARHPLFTDAASTTLTPRAGAVLDAGDLALGAGHTLLVRVEDQKGRALPGALVTARTLGWKGPRFHDHAAGGYAFGGFGGSHTIGEGAPSRQAFTDARGEASFGGLEGGSTRLMATAPGYLPWVDVAFVGDLAAPVPTLRLFGAATLSGQVLDARGKPVANALVAVTVALPEVVLPEPLARSQASDARQGCGGGGKSCGGSGPGDDDQEGTALGVPMEHGRPRPMRTDAQGRWRFEFLGPGATRVRIQAEGYADLERALDAPREGLEFVLQPRTLADPSSDVR